MTRKNTKRFVISVILILLLVGFVLIIQKVEKKKMIHTPSTHKEVEYLKLEQNGLGGKYRMQSVLYDRDCQYLQFNVKRIKQDTDELLFEPYYVTISIDGVERDRFSYLEYATWHGTYFVFLLDHVYDFEEIKFTFDGNTVTVSR